ncbi:(d)CMP kinase [Sporolactobacillus sp. THM19-2]|jgi:cytidylate kinase|uniref:(d)CMP kinase n=1 Tax=Sporolactobacillus sp. THM19-2 TaxID=2511171 RepID=UPI00101F9EC4|nr:(d)CMP kinase [Sporolactobacillus sp. THM19-2]RYL93215.1 (d)CMP kinase [Sporolactobacillus sp. THM19-2]
MERLFQIAIDGPAAAGKSTVAKIAAKKLGFIYIDTGAMYRSLTYKALKTGTDLLSGEALKALLDETEISLCHREDGQRVLVDGEDVTEQIRYPDVSSQVSLVSSYKEVRREMVRRQRILAGKRNVVMDGRDIGTHVLPNAQVKIFLKASVNERASRRFREEEQKGRHPSLESLKRAIALRDQKDTERKVSPLVKADDAVELDTTSLTVDGVVERILSIVKERRSR